MAEQGLAAYDSAGCLKPHIQLGEWTMRTVQGLLITFLLAGLAPAALAQPALWEPDFGAPLGLSDDSTANVPLGDFSFPFLGTTYTGTDFFNVSSNGFISINGDNGSDCCSGNPTTLVNDTFGRIAVFWADINPSSSGDAFVNTFDDSGDTVTDRLVVTFDSVLFDNNGPITVQAQLLSDGTIILGYNGFELTGFNDNTLVGVSPGGGVTDPGSIDFTADIPFDSGTEPTVYELWVGDPPPIDIDQTNIIFMPNGAGGWLVSSALPGGGPVPVIPEPVAVPALGPIALILLLLVVAGFGATTFRRH
jgi:hypothetical protein